MLKMSRRTGVIAFSLYLGTVLALMFRPGAYPPHFEGIDYVKIARGNYTQMETFYAGRVLHPLVVRAVAAAAHVPIDWRAFLWVAMASLVVLFGLLGTYFALETPAEAWLCVPLLATATVIEQYRDYYWHDLFYAMLCAAFFLTLRWNRWASLPILFLLYVTRESTLVLAVVVVVAAALWRQWAFSGAALAVGVAGAKITGALVARAQPSHHGISMLMLDALKIPYNFALNICGLEFWVNTDASTIGDAPKWIVDLPPWLHLGEIHQVGYCGFFWQRPAETAVLIASAFGILPLLVIMAILRKRGAPPLGKFHLRVAFAYGLLMFALTPLVGTVPARYVLYAWPLFWIFATALIHPVMRDTRTRVEFVGLCVLAAWVPAIVRVFSGPPNFEPDYFVDLSSAGLIASLAILAAIYVCGYVLLRTSFARSGESHRAVSHGATLAL